MEASRKHSDVPLVLLLVCLLLIGADFANATRALHATGFALRGIADSQIETLSRHGGRTLKNDCTLTECLDEEASEANAPNTAAIMFHEAIEPEETERAPDAEIDIDDPEMSPTEDDDMAEALPPESTTLMITARLSGERNADAAVLSEALSPLENSVPGHPVLSPVEGSDFFAAQSTSMDEDQRETLEGSNEDSAAVSCTVAVDEFATVESPSTSTSTDAPMQDSNEVNGFEETMLLPSDSPLQSNPTADLDLDLEDSDKFEDGIEPIVTQLEEREADQAPGPATEPVEPPVESPVGELPAAPIQERVDQQTPSRGPQKGQKAKRRSPTGNDNLDTGNPVPNARADPGMRVNAIVDVLS